jgi:hypothetical protein
MSWLPIDRTRNEEDADALEVFELMRCRRNLRLGQPRLPPYSHLRTLHKRPMCTPIVHHRPKPSSPVPLAIVHPKDRCMRFRHPEFLQSNPLLKALVPPYRDWLFRINECNGLGGSDDGRRGGLDNEAKEGSVEVTVLRRIVPVRPKLILGNFASAVIYLAFIPPPLPPAVLVMHRRRASRCGRVGPRSVELGRGPLSRLVVVIQRILAVPNPLRGGSGRHEGETSRDLLEAKRSASRNNASSSAPTGFLFEAHRSAT